LFCFDNSDQARRDEAARKGRFVHQYEHI
jgi:hypothetical protein